MVAAALSIDGQLANGRISLTSCAVVLFGAIAWWMAGSNHRQVADLEIRNRKLEASLKSAEVSLRELRSLKDQEQSSLTGAPRSCCGTGLVALDPEHDLADK